MKNRVVTLNEEKLLERPEKPAILLENPIEILVNDKSLIEFLQNIAKKINLPVTLVEVIYVPTAPSNNFPYDGSNYEELKTIISAKITSGKPVILFDWRPLRNLLEDQRFYGLLGNKRTAFLRLPFDEANLQKTLEHLNLFPNEIDNLAVQVSHMAEQNHQIGILKHDLEPAKLGTDKAKEAVDKINRLFGSHFALETEQNEARAFLEIHQENHQKVFENQELAGVFCDIEGTLLDIKTGEIKQAVLARLDELEKKHFIRLWTGGDVTQLRKKMAPLNRLWLVLSKHDFEGAKPEIVIDDLDQLEFQKKYGIIAKEYIKV